MAKRFTVWRLVDGVKGQFSGVEDTLELACDRAVEVARQHTTGGAVVCTADGVQVAGVGRLGVVNHYGR